MKPSSMPSIYLPAAKLTARHTRGVPHHQHALMHTGYTPLAFQVQGGERILCLDGGGIKGLIQIEVLIQIEELTGKRITELFNWIVGTSTGGIIALAMVYGEYDFIPELAGSSQEEWGRACKGEASNIGRSSTMMARDC